MEPFMETINYDNPCPGQANGISGYYFTQLMHMLLASHCTFGNPGDYPDDFGHRLANGDKFDFIIVGGGSSGSAIANRLTEISDWKVLLIEAGWNPTFESDLPGFSVSMPGSESDWKFEIGGNGNGCLGMVNETCSLFQGKVLGGSSVIDKMHYFRGNGRDYDEWENLGNKGWNYESVLRYYKKSERLDGEFKLFDEVTDQAKEFENIKGKYGSDGWKFYSSSKMAAAKYHSKNGILGVDHFAYDFSLSGLKKKLCDSAEEIGIPHVADVNSGSQIGCVRAMAAVIEGARANSAKTFLSPIKDRKNLFVARNATVAKIIVEGKTAKGVRLSVRNKMISVLAEKEVVVSAGAINSPKLLLLSGIGPRKDVESMGIDSVHDLPGVGENLQVHLTFFGLPFAIGHEGLEGFGHVERIDAMYQFVTGGHGPFGNVGMTDVVIFANAKKNESVPDLQFLHYLNRRKDYYTFNELLISLRIRDEIRDQFARVYSNSNLLLVCPTLLRPRSRGKVTLAGSDFKIPPKITSDFFRDREDVKNMIRGIRLAIELTNANSFRGSEPELVRLKVDGCDDSFEFDSDDYWECLIRHLATSMHDASGTCRMGPPEDVGAVVDEGLKVHGVKSLRVADSSSMPLIIRGSTTVGSIMIGEKVSDLIKSDWLKTRRNDEL